MSAPRLTPEELRASGYRLPDTDEALLDECDLTAFKSSGPGGQHKNTTLSSVRLHHRPSGLVVIGRRERSQPRNIQDAVTRLRERLREMLVPPRPRKKTRPTAASRERRLEAKRRRSRRKGERRSDDW